MVGYQKTLNFVLLCLPVLTVCVAGPGGVYKISSVSAGRYHDFGIDLISSTISKIIDSIPSTHHPALFVLYAHMF